MPAKQKRIIEVVDYSPEWPARFKTEADVLLEILADEIVAIHHIGSTAVSGLRAKPIIDILLEVKDVAMLDPHDSRMEGLGYIPKGEYGIPGRRFYLKGLYDRTHHVHAFDVGSDGAVRHIAFRDYLIAHPAVAAEYGAFKSRCAAECNNDNEKYCDLKEDFVVEHEKRAVQWRKTG